MNGRRYRIEYGATALGHLDSLPDKVRKQILRKIERLQSGFENRSMTKILEREIGRTVRQKRRQLFEIREEVEDLLDYLDVLEARAKDVRKPRLSHDEVKKRYG